MGTLWTPDGERVVPPAQQSQAQQQSSPQEVRNPDVEAMIKAQAEAIGIDLDTLSPEDRAAAEEAVMEMVETRQRLASVPASEVIANHATVFRHVANAQHGPLVTVNAGQVLAVKADRSLGGFDVAHDRAQHGGFACTVSPHQANHATAVDHERQPTQRHHGLD